MRFFLLILLTFLCAPNYAQISASLSKNTTTLDEPVQLILSVDHNSNGQPPNLIPLQTSFDIQATEHQVSTTIVNGQMQTFNQWVITLLPKQKGALVIPSIRIGNEQTAPLSLDVKSSSVVSPILQKNQLRISLSEKKPYLHQQIRYTVRLIHQDQLLDENYIPPEMEEALIVPLGSGTHSESIQNGQRIQIEEQEYALFPQKIGKQTIIAPKLDGLIYRQIMPERIHLRGKAESIDVQPIPKSYKGVHWLPAKRITLSEDYPETLSDLKIGSTFTRIITLRGEDIPAELLPTLKSASTSTFTIYPEKPLLDNQVQDHSLIGIKTLKLTYLINQSGTTTLPSYTLTWFNTQTQRQETSTLPSKTITIKQQNKPAIKKQIQPAPVQKPVMTPNHQTISWKAIAILSSGWLFALILLFCRFPLLKKNTATLKLIKQSCQHHDPKATRTALLDWAKKRFPHLIIQDLDDLNLIFQDPLLHQELSKLIEACWSPSSTPWTGETLLQWILAYTKKKPLKKKADPLPPINPTR